METIPKEVRIADSIEKFESAVLKHSEFMLKDSTIANQQFGLYAQALRELSKCGEDGLSAFAKLLESENIVIRVTAACYLIHYCTDKAISVLERAKREERGIAMLAIVTLKRWELGRYLDPATGAEVELQKPLK